MSSSSELQPLQPRLVAHLFPDLGKELVGLLRPSCGGKISPREAREDAREAARVSGSSELILFRGSRRDGLRRNLMIARMWHGVVSVEKTEAYKQYLLETGVADYRRTAGNRGVSVFLRREGETTHFLLLSLWQTLDSIRAFAGDDVERARYYPEDGEFLLELEPKVQHFEVFLDRQGHDEAGSS